MMTTDDTRGNGDATWLDDHVELYAVAALPPDESARAEWELASLPTDSRSDYEARIADIQTAMAGYAATFALDAPAELRDAVLTRVFDENPATATDTERETPGATTGSASEPGQLTVVPGGLPHTPGDSGSTGRRRGQHRSGDTAPRPARATAILAAAAVTVAVALGAGVLIGRTTAPDPSTTSSTAISESQREILDVLTAADATTTVEPLADDRGTIAVVTSKSADQAVTILRDQRRPIPSDRTFQLWLVGGADQPVSAGLIPGDDTAPVVVSDLGASSVLAVTIEPAGGSPQPTTPILAQVAL